MNPFQADILRAIARIGAETYFTDTAGEPGGLIVEYVPEALLWIEFWVPRTTATMGYHKYFDESLDGLRQEKLIISKSTHFPLRESQYVFRTSKGAEWELLVCQAEKRFSKHFFVQENLLCMQPNESIVLAAPMNRRQLFLDDFNSEARPTSNGMTTPNGFWTRGWNHPHVALEKSVWNKIDLAKEDFLTSVQFKQTIRQDHTDSDPCFELCDWLSKQPDERASFRLIPVRLYDDDVLSLCEDRGYIEFSDFELHDPLDGPMSCRWFWTSQKPQTSLARPPEPAVSINEPPGEMHLCPFVRLAENGRRLLRDVRLAAKNPTTRETHGASSAAGENHFASNNDKSNPTLQVNEKTRLAYWGNDALDINLHADFEALSELFARTNEVVSYNDLLNRIKPEQIAPSIQLQKAPQEVKDAVSHIRAAFRKVGCTWSIDPVRNKGYRLLSPDE